MAAGTIEEHWPNRYCMKHGRYLSNRLADIAVNFGGVRIGVNH